MSTIVRDVDQSILLHGVTWDSFREIAAHPQPCRMAYDEGVLELMSPSYQHEKISSIIGRLVEAFTEEMNLDIDSVGSTTLCRDDLEKAAEADRCYYFRDVKEIREKEELSFPEDPPPELAVEVEVTRSSRLRRGIFARLGIAEVWTYRNGQLQMLRLRNGDYIPVEASIVLPQLTAADLTRFIELRKTERETRVVQEFRAWVRQQFGAA